MSANIAASYVSGVTRPRDGGSGISRESEQAFMRLPGLSPAIKLAAIVRAVELFRAPQLEDVLRETGANMCCVCTPGIDSACCFHQGWSSASEEGDPTPCVRVRVQKAVEAHVAWDFADGIPCPCPVPSQPSFYYIHNLSAGEKDHVQFGKRRGFDYQTHPTVYCNDVKVSFIQRLSVADWAGVVGVGVGGNPSAQECWTALHNPSARRLPETAGSSSSQEAGALSTGSYGGGSYPDLPSALELNHALASRTAPPPSTGGSQPTPFMSSSGGAGTSASQSSSVFHSPPRPARAGSGGSTTGTPLTGTNTAAAHADGRLYFRCPFDEKEEFKALGGHWDNDERLWYALASSNLQNFSRWPRAYPARSTPARSTTGTIVSGATGTPSSITRLPHS